MRSGYKTAKGNGYAGWYRTLPLSGETLEKTMYRNAARLLGLDPDQ